MCTSLRDHLQSTIPPYCFPGSSAGKESACNAGDLGSIPWDWEDSPGEGNGYWLQYSWASLVAQMVRNLPTMWETWFYSWVGKIPWRRGRTTHSSILAWKIPWTEEPRRLQSIEWQKVRHDFHFLSCHLRDIALGLKFHLFKNLF